MEWIDVEELTSGYRDRMRRLALFDSLMSLDTKQTKDQNKQNVDMRGLGMLTLLFFFERRLSREYKTGVADLTNFLWKMTQETYQFTDEKLEKIARELITTFRPNTGKKQIFSFYNWETKQNEKIEYAILKDNGFDATTQTQYYTLAEEGLELLFATKEFYAEFQISINQLLLKQQIKKGEFHSALRQIREMELDVDTLRERMEKMRQDILRSIVSEETFVRYKTTVEDSYIRFEREEEEFTALAEFIRQTRDSHFSAEISRREEASYGLLNRIHKELEAVHYDHQRLLELTAELRLTTLETAQESLYYTGIQSFNFNQDIVTTILAKPHHPDKMKGALHPFLRVEENPVWSPLAVFAEQNIVEERTEHDVETFLAISEEEELASYRKWLGEKYAEIMEQYLTMSKKEEIPTLENWMEQLQEIEPQLLEERYFYSFWLTMHQYAPITSTTKEEDGATILQEVFNLLGDRMFIVEELPDVLRYSEAFSIQNMKITVRDAGDELF